MTCAARVMLTGLALALAGCVTTVPPAHSDFTQLRTEAPHSILVVPAINSSMAVNAPDYYLATITIPLAERGYYVFPVNMVKSVLADDGLSDANLVHAADPHRLGEMFGADAVLYVSIDHWDAKYVVLSTTVTVELHYSLKSTHTGLELWKNHQTFTYSPQSSSSGGLAGLIADAVAAAVTKAAPNYMPLANQANNMAINTKGTGLPAGPYLPTYGKDAADF
ncbi:MAG: DUF799 family lipoprotein [Proteobacteria bacterium]|nr:DUF799 family lipoprotein [Pseudomonadota bacterium]